MNKPVAICWFRQDLRLTDNPALCAAAAAGVVLPIYILDDINAGDAAMGAASRCWLDASLRQLNAALDGQLRVYSGDAQKILAELVNEYAVSAVYWNRCYEPWRIQRDKQIKQQLKECDVVTESFNASVLWEPWDVLKADGTPYKVFTPFYKRGCLNAIPPRKPLAAPKSLTLFSTQKNATSVDDLKLLPSLPWGKSMMSHWQVGEQAAQKRLTEFLSDGIEDYKEGRNFPIQDNVSRLSPHLHFGEISPNQVWYAAKACKADENRDCFLSELGWREFSYSLLYYCPELPEKNLQTKFDAFAWCEDEEIVQLWQRGQTGYPIVDAGMRELWQTGYMHNRVRMIVGSFLVKNLLLHWHQGEAWFWDCLVDADLASNSASWQWVAGCGADAAPYFRIFNPVTQGQKFDAQGLYTRHYVPELAQLPDKYLFNPWEAPAAVLEQAGVILGETYPQPIVELRSSRERALAEFKRLSA